MKLPLNNYRTVLTVPFILLLYFLSSCSEDDPAVDTTSPEVEILDLSSHDQVWNIVNLKVEADDNIGLEKVEIFVDDVLIATLTVAPYEFDWDSNTVEDGSHVIKVVATDRSGNENFSEVTVTVKNVLISVSIANDQLYNEEGYTERGFIFLSDETGNVIASSEYDNGQCIELKSSLFNGQNFYLTEALLENEDGEFLTLYTFPEVERGQWSLTDHRESDPTFIGEASLNFTNAAVDCDYELVTGEDATFVNEFNLTPAIRLTKSPTNLYVVKTDYSQGVEKKFRKFSGIVVGNNASIDLSQVNQSLTTSVATLPEGTMAASWELYGFDVEENFVDAYSLGYIGDYNNPSTLTVEYPGNSFPSYYAESYIETSSYYYGASGTQIHDFVPLQHSYNFTPGSGALSYTASGAYDIISAAYLHPDETGTWYFLLPKGSDQTIVLPELPPILAGKGAPDLTTAPEFFSIYDFASLDGYADLKSYIRQSSRGVIGLFERGKTFKQMDFNSNTGSGSRSKMPRQGSPLSIKSRLAKQNTIQKAFTSK